MCISPGAWAGVTPVSSFLTVLLTALTVKKKKIIFILGFADVSVIIMLKADIYADILLIRVLVMIMCIFYCVEMLCMLFIELSFE